MDIWLVEYVWASIEDEWFREDAEKRSGLGLNFCKNGMAELQKWMKQYLRYGAKGALRKLNRKTFNRASNILFVLFILFALWYTILSRTATRRRCDFRLFWALRAWLHEEPQGKQEFIYYLQNILFFIPFGFLHPRKKSGWKSVLVSAVLFSVFIETTQYVTARGMCEIDDVIANTAGAVIGFGMWMLLRVLSKMLTENWRKI